MALLTNNSPSAGYIKWNAMGMSYLDGNFPVPAGNTNKKYVVWRYNAGVPTLEMTDTKPTVMNDGDTILFLNMGGLGSVIAGTPLIDGGLVVDGSISANEIAANAVEAKHIKAGSVGADEIAAGAITAEKLSVGAAGDNLVSNGGFEDFDTAGYIAAWETPTTPTNGTLTIATAQGQMASGKMAIVFAPATTAANIRFRQKLANLIPVSGTIGKKYYVGVVAGVGGTASTNGFNIRVNWYDTAGAQLAGASAYTDVKSNIGLTPSFALYDGSVTAPAGARYMGLEIFVLNPSVVSNVHLDDVAVHEITIGAHIDSNAITAPKIKAGEINADHIAVGAIQTKHMLISDFSNLIQDPLMTRPFGEVWTRRSGATTASSIVSTTGAAGNALRLDGVSTEVSVLSDFIEVQPGEQYHLSVKVQQQLLGTSPLGYWRIDWYAKDEVTSGGAQFSWSINTQGWGVIENDVTVPAGAFYARMQFIHGAGCTGGNWWIAEPRMTLRYGGELIVDGAIAAKHVQAGAISTDKLSVGTVGDSLVTNGSFEEFANGMAVGWRTTAVAGGTVTVPTGIASSGAYALALTATSTTTCNLRVEQETTRFIPVSATSGRRWYISCRAGATATTTNGFYLRASWYDQAKVLLSTTDLRSNGSISTSWTVYEGQVAPPANAKYMSVAVFLINPNVLTTMYVDEIIAREVVVSAVIGDGQITTAKLVAKSVTADKLVITDTTNYVIDPGFELNGAGWNNVSTTSAPATGGLVATITGPRVDGTKALQLVGDGVNNKDVTTDNLTVRGGEWYYASCYVRKTVASTGTGSGQVGLSATITGAAAATYWWPNFDVRNHDTLTLNEWVLLEGQVQIPDGAKWFQLRPTVRSSLTAGTFQFDDFQLRRMNDGELIVDGTIKGNHIEAGSITADKMTIGRGANLFVDPEIRDMTTANTSGWTGYHQATGGRSSGGSIVVPQSSTQLGAYYAQLPAGSPKRARLVPGNHYRISGWVKTSAAAPAYSLSLYMRFQQEGSTTGDLLGPIMNETATVADTWTKITGVVYVPADTLYTGGVLGVFKESNYTTGTATFSDLSIQLAANGELIVNGSITASKLETDLVLATKIVAGNPNSTHAEMSPEGFKVFADDPADGIPNEVVRLGVAGTNDYFAITKADGSLAATIDQNGNGSFQKLDVAFTPKKVATDGTVTPASGDLFIGGKSFESIMWNMPRGHVGSAYRYSHSANNSVNWDNYQPYLRYDCELEEGRLYKISTSAIRMGITSGGRARVMLMSATGAGNVATVNSYVFTHAETDAEGNFVTLNEVWTPKLAGHVPGRKTACSFLIAFTAVAGAAGIRSDISAPTRLLVEDVGPLINTVDGTWLDGSSPPPPPQKVTYVRQYGCTNSMNYRGDNTQYNYDLGHMYQGLSPAGYGNLKSIGLFPDMTADLSGATIEYIRVYFNFPHWYYNSGGTAYIGAHGHTSIPGTFSQIGTMVGSGGWPKPGARWVDLPSNTFDGFKTGAYRGLSLQGDNTYGTYGYADRPTIEIRYNK